VPHIFQYLSVKTSPSLAIFVTCDVILQWKKDNGLSSNPVKLFSVKTQGLRRACDNILSDVFVVRKRLKSADCDEIPKPFRSVNDANYDQYRQESNIVPI
jgi:hypothetical protein